jgi:hypothetical protein
MEHMSHSCQRETVVNLTHITWPLAALKIATTHTFLSPHNPGGYDGGMNFLGMLGEAGNTQPSGRGATLVCSWMGKVSAPLPHDAYGASTPDVLYDFNGSGEHFANNDPRYFLPFDSAGLVLDEVHFDSYDALLEGWCYLRGGLYAWLYEKGLFRSLLLQRARKDVAKLNGNCRRGVIQLAVQHSYR